MNARGFFDPEQAKGPTDRPDVTGGKADAGADVTAEFVGGQTKAPWTVSDLLTRVREALAGGLPKRVTVVGEVSNFKRHQSGHLYFSLKDAGGQVAAVMFRGPAKRVRFDLTDGLEVVAEGRVDVYEPQGKLQLYVEQLSPKGAGALELAFRQLKASLAAEGLFDPAAKKPLPPYPRTIGVITSPTGAAVRDICRTLSRRWPSATVYVIGVRVQGEGSAEEIARALRAADAEAERLGLEVLIVARGGGSIEDLWSFNEEIVARAVAACRLPVISGVGHETDVTIADMVADVRAATPTAAAELATPDGQQLRRRVTQLTALLGRTVRQRMKTGETAVRLIERSEFFRNPLHRLQTAGQRVDEAVTRLRAALVDRHGRAAEQVTRAAEGLRWQLGAAAKRKTDALTALEARLATAHPVHRVRLGRRDLAGHRRHLATLARAFLAAGAARIDRLQQTLEAISYRHVLRRGYSVTRTRAGQIVRRPDEVTSGQGIRTELADGEIRSVVDGGPPRKRTRKRPDPAGPSLFEP